MEKSDRKRQDIIAELLDAMPVAKRRLFSRMHTVSYDSPLTGAQLEMLITIGHLGPISFKQLAAQLQLSPGGVSQLVDNLTQQGLIDRTAQPDDRRVQYLEASSRGRELLKKIMEPRRKVMEQLMEHLSDHELAVWLDIQNKIISEFQPPPTGPKPAKSSQTKGEK